MNVIEELVGRNARAAEGRERAELPAPPALGVAVVTCMDARIDVHRALGLAPGEAHVLRNAGGVVSDDVIRSLAISQRRLGTRAVMVVHHTRCGMAGLDEAELLAELKAAAGQPPPFPLGGFASVEDDVRRSVERVRSSPYLLHTGEVRGFVIDVDTLRLHEIAV